MKNEKMSHSYDFYQEKFEKEDNSNNNYLNQINKKNKNYIINNFI